jgi:hypothetical protein
MELTIPGDQTILGGSAARNVYLRKSKMLKVLRCMELAG